MPCSLAKETILLSSSLFPISEKPEEMMVRYFTFLRAQLFTASKTNLAGITMLATSTGPFTSSMLRYAGRPRISPPCGFTG